nr:MAG TPA: hypothetical protein [Caudoviricetes sp.]
MTIDINAITTAINDRKTRSAWDKGVTLYALELLDNIRDLPAADNRKEIQNALLNGARDWSEYSWGGCSLIYNGAIAERLCSPSELKRTRGGEWRPSRYEEWLDVQARALYKAFRLICRAVEGGAL